MCVCGGGGGGGQRVCWPPSNIIWGGGAGGGRDLFFLELTKSPSENEFVFWGELGGGGAGRGDGGEAIFLSIKIPILKKYLGGAGISELEKGM